MGERADHSLPSALEPRIHGARVPLCEECARSGKAQRAHVQVAGVLDTPSGLLSLPDYLCQTHYRAMVEAWAASRPVAVPLPNFKPGQDTPEEPAGEAAVVEVEYGIPRPR